MLALVLFRVAFTSASSGIERLIVGTLTSASSGDNPSAVLALWIRGATAIAVLIG